MRRSRIRRSPPGAARIPRRSGMPRSARSSRGWSSSATRASAPTRKAGASISPNASATRSRCSRNSCRASSTRPRSTRRSTAPSRMSGRARCATWAGSWASSRSATRARWISPHGRPKGQGAARLDCCSKADRGALRWDRVTAGGPARARGTGQSGARKITNAPAAISENPSRWLPVIGSPSQSTENPANTISVITSCMVLSSAAV